MNLLASILFEANVYNISQPYNNVSVQKYVDRCLLSITDPVFKKQMAKKLAHLIINDDTLLVPIKELPKDAPEWAMRALQAGGLMAFVPNEEVNDKIEHIVHYIVAAQEDTNSTNNDVKAFAVRELNGLPKVENLAVLYTKANEYFARGSHKASRSDEGMKLLMTAPGGFEWYLLTDQVGYQREGKLLQNCIGSHYTAERCQRDGTKIYVLRDRGGNSSVAIRVSSSNEVQEIKGKNNKPPVGKYMPSVQHLLNALKVTLSRNALRDVKGGGYYVIRGEVMPLTDAIDVLAKPSPVGNTNEGHMVDVVKFTDSEIFHDLTSSITNYRSYHGTDDQLSKNPISFYRLYGPGKTIIATAGVQRNVLLDVWNQTSNTVAEGVGRELVMFLANNKAFARVGHEIHKDMVFTHGTHIDPSTGNISPIEYDEYDEPDKTLPPGVKVFSAEKGQAMINAIAQALEGHGAPPPNAVRTYALPSFGVDDGRNHDLRITPVLAETEDGMLIPYAYAGTGDDFNINVMYALADNQRHVNRIAKLANDRGLQLPLYWCALTGTTKTEKGFKQLDVPKTRSKNGKFVMIDMTELSPVNRFIAVMDSLGLSDNQSKVTRYRGSLAYGGNPLGGVETRTDLGPLNPIEYTLKPTAPDMLCAGYPSDEELADCWKTVVAKTFGGVVPTRVFFKSQNTAGHFATNTSKPVWIAVDDNNNVIHVDTHTMSLFNPGKRVTKISTYDRKPKDRMIDAVNELITSEGLTVSPKALKDKYLTVVNNQITTPTLRAKAGLDKEGTQSTDFVDGVKIRKMTAQEYEAWTDSSYESSLAGKEPYYVIKDGKPIGAFLTTKGRIAGVFDADRRGGTDDDGNPRLPIHKRFSKELASYIKPYAAAHDLKLPTAGGTTLTSSSTAGRYLLAADERTVACPRGTLMREVGISQVSAAGYDAPGNIIDAALVAAGLINLERSSNRLNMSITPRGREVATRLRNGETVDIYDIVPTVGFKNAPPAAKADAPKEAEPKVDAPKEPTRAPAPSVGKTGTKAAMAMDRFRAMAVGGNAPSRADFIAVLKAEPFNMSQAGASTYYHNIKVKYAQEQGQLGETFTFAEYLMLFGE